MIIDKFVFSLQSPDLDKKGLFNLINALEFTLARLSCQLKVDLDFICEEGVKELLDLFDSLANLIKPILDNPHVALLNKHSVLGLYVRRTIIMFENLTFYKIVALFEDLKSFNNNDLFHPPSPLNTRNHPCLQRYSQYLN